jgi:hypothetical protein
MKNIRTIKTNTETLSALKASKGMYYFFATLVAVQLLGTILGTLTNTLGLGLILFVFGVPIAGIAATLSLFTVVIRAWLMHKKQDSFLLWSYGGLWLFGCIAWTVVVNSG